MKISIGCDHGAFELKNYLVRELKDDYEIIDNTPIYNKDDDYPVMARLVAKDVQEFRASKGIVLCTNGVGVCITANKIKAIRCALCINEEMAEHAVMHNYANVIAIGEVNQSKEEALKIVKKFLNTTFTDTGRHLRRVKLISKIEGEE